MPRRSRSPASPAPLAPLRRSRRLAPRSVPDSRLERLFDLGGVLLHPFVRRQDEGRTLAALEPVAAPLSVLVRRWAWPMPRYWRTSIDQGYPKRTFLPGAVAISAGGDIVVACDYHDADAHRIVVFRPDGTLVRHWGASWGAAPGQFSFPIAVAVSSADEVFVADCSNHRIQVFRLDGTFVRLWGSEGTAPGQFQQPSGVAVHGDLVLVSDAYNHRIQCFGLDGTFVRMWGSQGAAPGQFSDPQGLTVSSTGEVFVVDCSNHRIQVFRLDGSFVCMWGSKGTAPGQFEPSKGGPSLIAISPSGEVLVSDECRLVQVFLSDGTFVRRLQQPEDMVLPRLNQEEFEEEMANVRDYDSDDDSRPWGSDYLTSPFEHLNEHWRPHGVAVMPSGDIIVCDGANRVVIVEPAGV